MSVDLTNDRPLDWDSAALDADTKEMLNNLQPNILRAHVRDHLCVLFVRFNDIPEGRRFLRTVAVTWMKSTRRHLEEVREFARSGRRGAPYVGIGLSKAGYRDLGHSVEQVRRFGDVAFRDGMKRRTAALGDPAVAAWEPCYQRELHAVVFIGDARRGPVEALREEILDTLPDSARVLGEERGQGMRNPAGDGIEHFGYVDGRSQPLFLADEVAREPKEHWNPAFPLGSVLVPDPLAPDPRRHFGSYFVYRFTQISWANQPDFEIPATGHDPVIGQGRREIKVTYPKLWNKPEMSLPRRQVPQTVTMKGGEYFFMPSLAYLRAL